MKRFNRILSLLLTAVLVAALCSCGGSSSEPPAETAQAKEVETETKSAPAEDVPQEAGSEEAAQPTATETVSAAEDKASAATETVSATEDKASVSAALTAQPTQAEEIAEKYTVSELPVEGEYNLFAVRNEGYTVSSESMEMTSAMVLSKEGNGSLTLQDDSIDITSWTSEDGVFKLTLSDGTTADGNARGGILELDIYGTGDMFLIYAQQGADTSGYTLLTIDEVKAQMEASKEESKTKLDHAVESIDAVSGAHLRYRRSMETIDTVQTYDVCAKDGAYYSSRTTKVGGIEDTVITVIQNGKVYNLYPKKMTGNYVTDLPLSITDADILLMDDLYSEMRMASVRTDAVLEDRELEGRTYPAEVYPETEYTPETIFYFDEDGSLAYCFAGKPVIDVAAELGDSLYTVEAIDTEVDESLFDISAYAIDK